MRVPEFCVLGCRICSQALNRSFVTHCKEQHKVRPNPEQIEYVKTTYLSTEAPYFKRSDELLQPLPFLPVHEGFKCSGCPYYSKRRKTVADHITIKKKARNTMAAHLNATPQPCPVQKASDNPEHPYFGVISEPVAPQAMPEDGQGESRRAPRDVIAMTNALHQTVPHVAAPIITEFLSLFYKKTRWLQLHDMTDVPMASLISGTYSEMEKNFFTGCKTIALDGMAMIREADYSFRFLLGSPGKVFDMHERKESRDAYASVFGRFVVFLVRVLSHEELPVRLLPEGIILRVAELLTNPNDFSIWSVMILLLELEPNAAKPKMHPMIMFLRFMAVHDPNEPMDPENISRLLAKVPMLLYWISINT